MEYKVETSELRSKADGETVKELAEFLEGKTGGVATVVSDGVLLSLEEETFSKTSLRVLLRKFLHQTQLKGEFRVISGGEDKYVLKERKESPAEE